MPCRARTGQPAAGAGIPAMSVRYGRRADRRLLNRSAMAPTGWEEARSAIRRPNDRPPDVTKINCERRWADGPARQRGPAATTYAERIRLQQVTAPSAFSSSDTSTV